eukprot:Nk52_evm8s359 gene=Nk52_evmTU8s359
MSSTENSAHRQLNVDAYDEDRYVKLESEERSGVDSLTVVQKREQEVRRLVSMGNLENALKTALSEPPTTAKDVNVKTLNCETVMSVLTAYKGNEIGNAVKSLNSEELDILMKYIYKGMGNPESGNSPILLSWHEKTVEHAGLGSIVRVLTDKNSV